MRFVDTVTIHVEGGRGGDGCVAWRREKYLPRGGPYGGDGGKGGAVIFEAISGLNTLIDFSFNPLHRAKKGGQGDSNCKTGRNGEDLVCRLPVGTQVFFDDKLVADLSVPGARWVAAPGGRGGKGNAHFKTASNQAPDYAQPGKSGANYSFNLILKSVADVGLVGFPNVGKSTLISKISAAKPKIADYEFTTLRPNLGVVRIGDEQSYVVADIPGLIEGAHDGKGLGIEFLKHIERTKVLAQIIDCSKEKVTISDKDYSKEELQKIALEQFEAIETELRNYDERLLELPRLIVFSKADLPINTAAFKATEDLFNARGFPVILTSAETSAGLVELTKKLFALLQGI